MADITQGVNYEITAEDKTGQATESALANLIRQEQVAKKANEKAKKDAAESKSFFTAITNALAGNFQALTEHISKAAAKMGGFTLGPKMLGAVGFAVAGVVAAVKGLAEAFTSAAAEERELAEMQLQSTIGAIGDEAKEFADEMARARSESENMRKIFDDEVQSVREMAKAQNELIKQRELAMARTPEERDAIERRHARNNAYNDAYLDEETRRQEIRDAEADISRLERELQKTESAVERYRKAGQGAASALQASQDRGFWGTLWGNLTDKAGFTDNKGDEAGYARHAEETAALQAEAQKKVADIREQLEMARHRLEMANRKEELSIVQSAAEDQKNLNEDFQRMDEQIAKDEAAAEEESVRRIEELRLESEQKVEAAKLKGVRDVETAEAEAAAARDRLASAQAAVRQAWGWYRDKDSLKAQLDEEKANADAERQFEKDFAKLSFRRDWRTAKNLSVDQEAVRRVGIAREEEAAAKKAAAETAVNTAKAVEELSAIRGAITEEA